MNASTSTPHEALQRLGRIFTLYDEIAGPPGAACHRGCAHCCTANVTLTTLEGMFMISQLNALQREELAGRISRPAPGRFRPGMTTNAFAAFCLQGRATADDDPDPGAGPCPLLQAEECLFYALRPFGCRCMTSLSDCGKTGEARMRDWDLSVNQVFLQCIEHLDARGVSGNLTDMLGFVLDNPCQGQEYPSLQQTGPAAAYGLVPNQRIPALMIPPEHRVRMAPILARLDAIAR